MEPNVLLGAETMLLSERLRVTLAQEIASGALTGGSVLDEQALASRFGVSRTPVREALRQLAAVGMIDTRPRRGAVVITVTPARMMALFEASAEIEATCARLATYRMTMAERAAIQRVHREAEALARRKDHDGYIALNQEFHDLVYQATHNEVLVEQAMALRMRLSEFRGAQLRNDDRAERSWAEHEAILAAMAQGDGAAAERHMRAHLLNAASTLQTLATQIPRPFAP
ncbi:MAG TPA: GntR family transcriptional regulator, partial [Phenylobacterium sp.]|nr:GntR family transcriptional regulator [Phenylobacterium sp.]